MKKKFTFLMAALMLLTMMVLPGKAVGQSKATYSYTFESKQYSANGAQTLGGISWTLAGDGGYWGYEDARGQQFGSGSNPYKSLTLTTTGITGTITSIVVYAAMGSSANATISCTVDGSDFGTQSQSLTTSSSAYTFSSSGASGTIVISMSQSTKKALYIKQITITYTTGSTHTVTYAVGEGGSGTVPTGGSYAAGATVTVANRGGVTHGSKGFRGWYDGVNTYDPGDEFTMGSSDVTLTAVWTTKCTFTYDANGADDGDVPDSYYTSYGEGAKVVVLGNAGDLEKDGAAWVGWNNNATGTGTTYQADDIFTINGDVTLYAKWRELATYELVTNTSDIEPGKHYIIANSKTTGDAYAMGAQGDNNRGITDIKIYTTAASKQAITEVIGLYEFVISGPTIISETKYYTIYDKNATSTGYLYAPNTSKKNYLRTRNSIDDDNKAIWTITIESGDVAKIQAKISGRNLMRFNTNLFSCYESGQDPIYLYKKVDDKNFEFYSPSTIASVTIAADETYTVTDGQVLDVTSLTNNGTAANLIVEDGAQLIVHNSDVQATFQKEITSYNAKGEKDGYALIAKPTTGNVDPSSVTGMLANNYDLYYFDESKQGLEWRNYKMKTFNIENGKGYLYANSNTFTLNFTGEVPTGTSKSDIPLSFTTGNTFKGFNLMGNPLSVNIESMKINSTACGYYKLNNDGTFTGVTDVAAEPVVVGQGFMVEASANTDKLHLNPAAKDEESFSNEIIGLEVANSKYTDVAYICFGSMMPLTKINHMNDEAPMIYIHNESTDNAVAVYNNRGEVKSIDVNFEAKTTGAYTISAKMMIGEVKYMHLYDRLTGIDTDLLMDDYSFIGAKGDNTGRFILNLESIDDNSSTGSDTFAYQSGNDIIVNGEGTLEVYDITGRKVMATTINGVENINGLNSGVYIFRVIGETLRTQKIVVR